MIGDLILNMTKANGLIVAFVLIGAITWFSYWLSRTLTKGRLHGSAIAIAFGLILAGVSGAYTGGNAGLADIAVFAGIGVMGGNMFRDFAIIATAYGASLEDLKSAGFVGAISILIGVVVSFVLGAIVAVAFGYTDPVAITTIGAGAVTYIVGPVTGTALGASSDLLALSVAAGLVKAILVMLGTPALARYIGLDNPQSAMVYGGLMGTNSGVAAGLAATDPKLVPYGVMTATFYTGLGCLLGPSVLFLTVKALAAALG
ncbi:MAG: malonate transporter subunit MadM [Gammaproteobacteria bacterium]|jgi:malonate transporter MadM subunit|nr:MAG: malonate transporter subunit MadM [Gammaproteobacteria bacterium]